MLRCMIDRIPLFIGTTLLVLAIPGPDFVVVTRNTLSGTRRRGYLTVLGICAGLSFLTVITATGLATLIASHPVMLTVLRLAGGGYLVLLASALAVTAWRRRHRRPADSQPSRVAGSPLRQGFLSNVLNPKALVFYLTFMPQFVAPGAPVLGQTLLMGTLVVLCAGLWWTAYITAIGVLAPALRRTRARAAIDAVAASALGGLGVSTLFSAP